MSSNSMSTDSERRLPTDKEMTDLCEELADLAQRHHIAIGTAESLTAGNLAALLGKAPSSGEWFRGGIVAYAKEVKQSMLHVPEGPVVSEQAASAMAESTSTLLGADLAIALTGEAGPQPNENDPPGTVWIAVCDRGVVTAVEKQFEGDPEDVLARTLEFAVQSLLEHARAR